MDTQTLIDRKVLESIADDTWVVGYADQLVERAYAIGNRGADDRVMVRRIKDHAAQDVSYEEGGPPPERFEPTTEEPVAAVWRHMDVPSE